MYEFIFVLVCSCILGFLCYCMLVFLYSCSIGFVYPCCSILLCLYYRTIVFWFLVFFYYCILALCHSCVRVLLYHCGRLFLSDCLMVLVCSRVLAWLWYCMLVCEYYRIPLVLLYSYVLELFVCLYYCIVFLCYCSLLFLC